MTPLRELLSGILKSPTFPEAMISALDVQIGTELPLAAREPVRHALFERLHSRVASVSSRDRRQKVVARILIDASQLRDVELHAFLDYMQYCLVNHFSGELAELFAWPVLLNAMEKLSGMGRMPREARIIPGHALLERQPGNHVGWYKGADALIVVDLDKKKYGCVAQEDEPAGLGVLAIVEIKAARVGIKRVLRQLDSHLQRLTLGLQVQGRMIPPDRLFVPARSGSGCGRWKPLTTLPAIEQVHRVAVRPATLTREPQALEFLGANAWSIELPVPRADLLEAAYRFAIWHVCQEGNRVYCAPGTASGNRIPNPHPVAFEEAAQHVLVEALYHFGHDFDLLRLPKEKLCGASAEELRRRRTFNWLYNSLCYGHDFSEGDRMLSPTDFRGLPRALATAESAPAETKRAGWNEGMASYREGRFEDAAMVFPGPLTGAHDYWWTRDVAMTARLLTRTGHHEEARRHLDQLLPLEHWPYGALKLEYLGVRVLSYVLEGDWTVASQAARACQDALDDIRRDLDERRARGVGSPPTVHPTTVHMAIFDLVAAQVAIGNVDQAFMNLSRLRGLDEWKLHYLERDLLLKPLFADPDRSAGLKEWKEVAVRD